MNRLLLLGALLALVACDEETADPPVAPPAIELPDDPDPEYGLGHWEKARRGIALDADDLAVVQPTIGLTPERLDQFGRLVLNLLLVEDAGGECARESVLDRVLPRPKAEELLAALQAAGISFDAIAANVDLIRPSRDTLLYACFQMGASAPRFDVLEHRASIVDAFVDLAGLPGMTHITVGLEMNRYFHLRDADDVPQEDDYSNFATLYREVYRAIKAAHPDVRVGPGIHWAFFRLRTAAQMRLEYELEENGLEAVVRAYERTVKPLLIDPNNGEKTADYLGVSILPFVDEQPFGGDPSAGGEAALLDYYRHVRVLLKDAQIPLVLPQVDWPTPTAALAGNKGVFLENLQRALSHVDIEWAAWRRVADLANVQGSSDCAAHMALGHPRDYCSSGMVAENGDVRAVLDVFTADP